MVNVSSNIYVAFKRLVSQLQKQRTSLQRVVVFCRSINRCASLYKMILTQLREESYEPCGSMPSITNRLFAMYHARVRDYDILASVIKPSGKYHVLFCTTAVGMGGAVPVIHFGPLSDIDDYFQESGRTGQDGIESEAVLFVYPGCLLDHVSRATKDYCSSRHCCRRDQLCGWY